jgi:hypothetical protein
MYNTIQKKFISYFITFIFLISTIITLNSEARNELEIDIDNNINDILNMIEKVNESLISFYLENLVSFGPRFTGTDKCRASAEYIYEEFKSLGLNVSYHYWNSSKYSSKNVVATVLNKDKDINSVIILCAHYDTTETSPGANDDGSGIAAMLTIANIINDLSFKNTIRFVAFSGEEIGTFGSHFYARYCYDNEENIISVINLDTIGYTTEVGGDFLYLLKTDRSNWISSMAINISHEFRRYFDISIKSIANRRNDHQSFIEYGYDAIQFVQLERGDYPLHTPEDTIDKINYSYLSKVVKLVLILTYKMGYKEFDTQVRLITPKEGYLYIFNNPVFHLPGFNIRGTGLRGMTYLIGKTVSKIEILTNENINSVVFCLDGHSSFSGFLENPPFEWTIEKSYWSIKPFFGKHILGVYVTTESGLVVYDEMDIFII